jgi:O-acetyl-ADP-ribose deacetylase (regulator of RNase III)
MINIKDGDLLSSDCDVICHQVNARGVMGAGIAKQIRNRFPFAYVDYMKLYQQGKLTLGTTILSTRLGYPVIAHLVAQDNYGRNGKYTNNRAFRNCLNDLINKLPYTGIEYPKIGFPFGIGCGLGGGKWNEILPLIEKELAGYNVFIYRRK